MALVVRPQPDGFHVLPMCDVARQHRVEKLLRETDVSVLRVRCSGEDAG